MSERSLRSRTRRSVEWAPSFESLAEQNATAVGKPEPAKEAAAPKKPVARRQPTERGRGRGRGVVGEEGELLIEPQLLSQSPDPRPLSRGKPSGVA